MSRAFNSLDASYGGSEEHISSRSNSGPESLRPEFHRKKARLLYMQEEVAYDGSSLSTFPLNAYHPSFLTSLQISGTYGSCMYAPPTPRL
ncbi:hypothetical protein L1887_16087 [Cichorium endivia]|nr:hypothetical protein L1887_16087 [Cichorium endivia]